MNQSSLVSSFLEHISLHIKSSTQVTVAYSGGLDSSVLLHLCKTLRDQTGSFTLQAIHVNHGLSKHAASWEQHCQAICDSWHVPLIVQQIKITPKNRTSLEQQARNGRYQAIQQAIDPQSLILLGQHQDDQAETYLLQLARGAGSEGLSGMPERFTSASGHGFVRPLLGASRKQLFEYAQSCQLPWVEDESNVNENFYRNFVRHKVMPVLQEKWPSIATTISRSAKHHANSVAVVDEYMKLLSDSVIDPQGRLLINPWLSLSKVSQNTMLRYWLKSRVSNMPSASVLAQISNLPNAQEDAQPECCWGEDMVSRFAGKLYIRKIETRQTLSSFEVTINSNTVFSHPLLPYDIEQGRSHDKTLQGHCFIIAKETLKVEFGGFSKICKLDPRRPSKSIKKWFQEWQIPPWERGKVPILMQGEEVLAVGNHLALFEQPKSQQTNSMSIIITPHLGKKMPA